MSKIETLPHELVITRREKKGARTAVSRTSWCYFRVTEIRVADDSSDPGLGTLVRGVFVGNQAQAGSAAQIIEAKPSRYLSMEKLGIGKFDTCQPMIPFSFDLEFLEDCEWRCTLIGIALKQPGAAHGDMKKRVLDEYMASFPPPRDAEEAQRTVEYRKRLDAME